MFLRKHSHTLSIAFSLTIILLFPALSHADLNLGIVSAIKNQAKSLNDKQTAGTTNHVVAGSNARFLSAATLQHFVSYDGTTLVFDSAATEIGTLQPGSVIFCTAAEVQSLAPQFRGISFGSIASGLIRKVVSVFNGVGQFIITTEVATFCDLIDFANINTTQKLIETDIPLNCTICTDATGQVTGTGDISISASMTLVLLKNSGVNSISTLKVLLNFYEKASLTLNDTMPLLAGC